MPDTTTLDSHHTPDAFDPDNDHLIIARALARKLGVSTRTIERWVKADHIGFPKPDLITKDRTGRPANRFWRASSIAAWEAQNVRPQRGRPATTKSEAA